MVGPREGGLEIAEHSVNPLELQQVLRLAAADDGRLLRAVGYSDGVEAGQTVGVHGAPSGCQVLARSKSVSKPADVFGGETGPKPGPNEDQSPLGRTVGCQARLR